VSGGLSLWLQIVANVNPTPFIHLTRADKLEQAISLIKARQSGFWHLATDGSELEPTKPGIQPGFDRFEISETIKS
jgi:LPS sulfotransferase NodH